MRTANARTGILGHQTVLGGVDLQNIGGSEPGESQRKPWGAKVLEVKARSLLFVLEEETDGLSVIASYLMRQPERKPQNICLVLAMSRKNEKGDEVKSYEIVFRDKRYMLWQKEIHEAPLDPRMRDEITGGGEIGN